MSKIDAFIKSDGMPTIPPKDFYIGWDVGQAADYSALCVLERHGQGYLVKHLERRPLDEPYPKQVEHLFGMWFRKPLRDANKLLAIDYTGVGRPVYDLVLDRGIGPTVGISITGGDTATWQDDRKRARVPKRDLVSLLQVFAQNNRLKVAQNLKYGPVLAQELQSFKVKIDSRTAHDSYGSWREGEHDDLILSLACGLWAAENHNTKPFVFRGIRHGGRGW